MRDPDRALRLVDVLPAGAAGPERVDLEVGVVDLDLDGVVHHRIDPHAGKAGLPARRRIERADPHQAMHPGLGLQPAIGIQPRHLKRRRLDARLLAVALFQQLDLAAMPLGPARIHAGQHLGPVLRLRAASTRVHLDERIPPIGLSRQQALDLQPLGVIQHPAQRADAIGDHAGIPLRLRHLDQIGGVGRLLLHRPQPVDLGRKPRPLPHHRLGGVRVVPQRRVFDAGVQFFKAGRRDIPVKDASSAARWSA